MTAHPEPPEPPHGARRLTSHPVLGELPPAPEATCLVDGRPLAGRAGEPILAALLAAGLRVCRTMPLGGEVRGGYCLVGRCADCLIRVDGEPNVRACVTPLRDGMRIATQRGLGTWHEAASDTPAAPTGDGGAA
jgi:hypothetical protein